MFPLEFQAIVVLESGQKIPHVCTQMKKVNMTNIYLYTNYRNRKR